MGRPAPRWATPSRVRFTRIVPGILSTWAGSVLHGVDDLGEEESHLGRDRAARVGLLDEVEALVHGGESELTVEQDDVIGVDLGAGREQLHRQSVPGRE